MSLNNELLFVDYVIYEDHNIDEEYSYIKCKVKGREGYIFFDTTELSSSFHNIRSGDEIEVCFRVRSTDKHRKEIVNLKALSVKKSARLEENMYPVIFRCHSLSNDGGDWANAYFDFELEDGSTVPLILRYDTFDVLRQANSVDFNGCLISGQRYKISVRIMKTRLFWDWNSGESRPLPQKNGYDQYKPVLKLHTVTSA